MAETKLQNLKNIKLPLNKPVIIIAIGIGVAIFGFIFIRSLGSYVTGKVSQQLITADSNNAPQFPDIPGFQKLTIEREMERRIQSVLDEIIGPRKSVVRVSVSLTPQIQDKDEVNTPKPLSTKQEEKVRFSSERDMKNGDTSKDGSGEIISRDEQAEELPGYSELGGKKEEDYFIYPGYPANAYSDLSGGRISFEGGDEMSGTSRVKEASSTQYTLDRKTVRTVTPAGSISSITVSALIDVKWIKPLIGKVRRVGRSEKELQLYRSLVENIVGYNPDRGDRIEIANVSFEGTRPAVEMMENITLGITILILLPLLYIIVRTTLNFLKKRAEEKQELLEKMEREEQEEKQKQLKAEQERRESIQMHQEQVFTIGRTHADICARIIRNWLT